jgi:hypothetical protein
MTDILGPASAPNATTVRPSEGRTFAAIDSWFKDCTSSDVDDGTDIQANWLNGVIAAMRSVWRGNGFKADGVTPVVAENGTDDNGLLTSVSHLMQRGQPQYGRDTSTTAGVLTVQLTPTPAEYKEGMTVHVKAAITAGAGSTLNLSGLGAIPIIRPDGTALRNGDIVAGSVNSYRYDGAKFQLLGADSLPTLKQNTIYYVDANLGNDAFDGTTAAVTGGHGPFKTHQAAVNAIANVNLNGYSVTVITAHGVYPSIDLLPVSGSGTVSFFGDPGAQQSVVIAGNTTSAVLAQNCGNAYSFEGFMFQSTGAPNDTQMAGVNAYGPGTHITLTNITWGPCEGAHMAAVFFAGIDINGNHTIVGGCSGAPGYPGCHAFAFSHGAINSSGTNRPSMFIANPVSFAGAFIEALELASVSLTYSAIGNPTNVTGVKFICGAGGLVNSGSSGVGYFPGNIAGQINDGFYV